MSKNNNAMKYHACTAHRSRGFSLIELMVAMVLGLVLTYAMLNVFITSKTAFKRQEQLNSVQQSVRMAFEYLTNDARMVGHLGCYTGRGPVTNNLPINAIATNYGLGVEGYEYNTGSSYSLTSNSPNDDSTAGNWKTNADAAGITAIPVTTIGGAGGITPGSDVLVIRTVAGKPVRLVANAATAASSINIENFASGNCSGSAASRVSGICSNSHVMIANCQSARVFSVVSAASASNVTLSSAIGADFATGTTEVFPMQTIVYYVKKSSSGTTTSLYRRIFDGDKTSAAQQEQELIEGVENMQLRYGIDSTPTPDGVIDSYTTADGVGDWSRVVAIRMSVLMRAADPLDDASLARASGVVNGVTVSYPTTGSKYDRRVFTTTVAVRNRISYF